MPPQTTALLGHVYNWLQTVGYPVRTFTGSYGTPHEAAGFAGWANPGNVWFDQRLQPSLDSVAARLGKRGAVTPDQQNAVRIAMHEALHQMQFGRSGTIGVFEEGATEASTQDLLPIFLRKMYGHVVGGDPKFRPMSYQDDVKSVRQLSTFGSGARKFTDRPARVWRRTFLHSDTATRQKMVADATAKRVEWGKVTGR